MALSRELDRHGFAPLGAQLANAPELLLFLLSQPRDGAFTLEIDDHRYAQVWVHGDTEVIVVECVSNHFLPPDQALSEGAMAHLEALGFEPPSTGPRGERPNWRWEGTGVASVLPAAERLAVALTEVLGGIPQRVAHLKVMTDAQAAA